jgi:tripartite-type tricarboxylate transporter receptor subunit TctC
MDGTMILLKHAGIISLCALAFASLNQAWGQSVEQFYKGRTVTLIIPTSAGGINDLSGRLVAKHIGRFIPGQPTVVAQNIPAGGGLALANRFAAASEADRDGSFIAVIQRAIPQLAIQGDPGAKFDPQKFTWLGSLSTFAEDAYILVVNANHPAKTAVDLKKPGITVKVGADAPGSTNLTFALICKEVLGLHVETVGGFTGAAALSKGMRDGDLDGQVIGLVSVSANQPEMWNSKAVRPLIQFGRTTRHPDLTDVPTGRDLTSDPKALALLEFAELPFFMALPFVAPADLPADRAAALKSAFMTMVQDKAFLEDAKKAKLDISPIDGEAIRQLLAKSAATPKDVIAHYNEISVAKK